MHNRTGIVVLALVSVFSQAAVAHEESQPTATAKPQAKSAVAPRQDIYLGVKGSIMEPDGGGYDDAINVGLDVGLPLSTVGGGSSGLRGTISFEGEITFTIIKGDFHYGVPIFGRVDGDWDVWTLGGYAVFRSPTAPGHAYFKGKAGILHYNVDVSAGGFNSSDDDTDAALGIGFGYQLNRRNALEFDITFSDNLDMLNFGYRL